ncbi:hypothetical protein AVEN_12962-1 [Araneus ventricosus]|uniref:Uncharacterized protein n=1 Tax=Araneus ventricosus TaxID=182803 RepID=A0A4Y2N6N2_ARAVE|nr:hypothetical protein AVEN_12962-1 [Araneus ventricosus]
MTFGPRCVLCNRVPLHSLGILRLRISSTGTPTFNLCLLEGAPDNSKMLKSSTQGGHSLWKPGKLREFHSRHWKFYEPPRNFRALTLSTETCDVIDRIFSASALPRSRSRTT